MGESLYDRCLRDGKEHLLREWDRKANLPLTPERISYGSKRKVWWMCEQGHAWQAAVHTRTGSGTGCPVCAGKVPLAGSSDLATRFPDLAAQWHPTLNGGLRPQDVLPGSHKAVWWQCEKGHVWWAQIKSRVSGCGCPVCTNREILAGENGLSALYPDLAAQWHPTKNGSLSPDTLAPGSRRRVWWQCEKGHQWQATVASRTCGGTGCPVCAGRKVVEGENDLASCFPQVAAQWHPTKNGVLTPKQVTPYANRKVWWLCPLGHEYLSAVSARTKRGSGCPYCSGRKVLPGFNDLATVEPQLALEWYAPLNGGLTPRMVTAGSHQKVWWRCSQGHVWQAVIHSRASSQKCGCPICAGRISQKRLARYQRALAMEEQSRKPFNGQPLLERLAIQMHCPDPTGLLRLSRESLAYLAEKLSPLIVREEDQWEWNQVLTFLTGAPPEPSAQTAKDRLLALLGGPPCGENAP